MGSPIAENRGQKTPTAAYRAYVLVILLLAYAMSYFDRFLVGTLAPLIKSDTHLSDSQLGLMNGSAYAVLYVIFCLPFGWLADRYSRKRIISGALAVWSVATAFFGLGQSYAQLLLSRVLLGASEAGGLAPSHSMLVDYFPREQRARVLAIYAFGISLGISLGAALGSLLGSWLGWRLTFVCAAGAGLILALIIKLTIKEPVRIVRSESERPLPLVPSVAAIGSKPAFWWVVGGISCGALAGYPQYFWLPSFFVRSFGLNIVQVGSVIGGISLIGGIGGAWTGAYISDHLGKKWQAAHPIMLAMAYLVSAPFLFGTFFVESHIASYVMYATSTFFISFGHGPSVAAVQHLATARLRGTASAIMNIAVVTVGMGLSVPLIGVLSDTFSSWSGSNSLQYALIALPAFQILGGISFLRAARLFARGKDGGLVADRDNFEMAAHVQ